MEISAEQSLLGCILLDERQLAPIRAVVNADCFASRTDRGVFSAACALADSGIAVDPVTVLDKAVSMGFDVSSEYIVQLMDVCTSVRHAEAYAKAVADNAFRRSIAQAAKAAAAQCESKTDPGEIAAELTKAIEAASELQPTLELMDSLKSLEMFARQRRKVDNGEAEGLLSTGYSELDRLLGGGLLPGGLYILAARPGVGKTTVALNIAEKAAERGDSVLFVSLEMTHQQITNRRIAITSGLACGELTHQKMDMEKQTKMALTLSDLSLRSFYQNLKPGLSVSDIGYLAGSIKGLQLLVVDYLGLIRNKDEKGLYERTTANSMALKQLALKLGVPVLCLAQLNRASAAEKREPKLYDLRDSGAIEQDADGVILLHEAVEREEGVSDAPKPLVVILAKNRHGNTGRIRLDMYCRNLRVI